MVHASSVFLNTSSSSKGGGEFHGTHATITRSAIEVYIHVCLWLEARESAFGILHVNEKFPCYSKLGYDCKILMIVNCEFF